MRGYGLPRNHDVEMPDVADLKNYALKSAAGTIRGKGGDFRGYWKNSQSKRNQRRIWKKAERMRTKRYLRKQMRRVHDSRTISL